MDPRPKQFAIDDAKSNELVVSGDKELRFAPSFISPRIFEGRLTLDPSNPIMTSSSTVTQVLYLLPYIGGSVSLYDVSLGIWKYHSIPDSGVSIDISTENDLEGNNIIADTNYDVYVSEGGTDLDLHLVAWSSSSLGSSRTNTSGYGMVELDKILVLESDNSKRYIGTVRTDSSNQLVNSQQQLFVWNFYNQIFSSSIVKLNSNLSTSGGSFTPWGSSFQIEFVQGHEMRQKCQLLGSWTSSSGLSFTQVGIGLDSTSVAQTGTDTNKTVVDSGGQGASFESLFDDVVSEGYHYFQALYAESGGTISPGDKGNPGMYTELSL